MSKAKGDTISHLVMPLYIDVNRGDAVILDMYEKLYNHLLQDCPHEPFLF